MRRLGQRECRGARPDPVTACAHHLTPHQLLLLGRALESVEDHDPSARSDAHDPSGGRARPAPVGRHAGTTKSSEELGPQHRDGDPGSGDGDGGRCRDADATVEGLTQTGCSSPPAVQGTAKRFPEVREPRVSLERGEMTLDYEGDRGKLDEDHPARRGTTRPRLLSFRHSVFSPMPSALAVALRLPPNRSRVARI